MELKEKLAGLRARQGLTQGELASKINVSRQTVSKWERGEAVPSTENLIGLSRLYGVPLDEFANGEPQPEGGPPVAVAEEPEALPPADGKAPGKRGRNIALGAVLAACLALMTVASVITIWSAIFKGPEEQRNKIIRTEDIEPEYIDPVEIIYDFEGRMTIP